MRYKMISEKWRYVSAYPNTADELHDRLWYYGWATGNDAHTHTLQEAVTKGIIQMTREWRDHTQREVAEIIDVPRNTLARWESGRHMPQERNLRKIADYLLYRYIDG